ncbi:hypothetical protein LCGC14_0662790 [marine sediment metagenome]|uniref:Uncharacterized protein n=1 Tax=marine sediment metagenome TaxID=412755 RepID=A0A0F9QY61_9ZZZZ
MDTLLTQTAVIKRRDSAIVGPDPFTAHTTVPCRLKSASGERVLQLPGGLFTVTHVVYLQAGVDVKETDRIEVRDSNGIVLASSLRIGLVRKVASLGGKTHHLELPCTAMKDATS